MIIRPRRLRRTPAIREMVRETSLTVKDFIAPLFVKHGQGIKDPISTMPGQYQFSVDTIVKEVVQQAVSAIKDRLVEMVVITDVCLCEYTDHGHCGVIRDGRVENDATLELLARQAVSHAKAGADFVAPSDMMDGRVTAIRKALDGENLQDIAILSYAVKYASAFYGPFREAADSAPQFGDRASYQMDPPNALEALKEAELDMEEGADIIMVKPAMPYLDIISRVREVSLLPLAAYNVSGEYAMIKAAEMNGWLDGKRAMMEMLTSIKRAGADLIITYFAKEAARRLTIDY